MPPPEILGVTPVLSALTGSRLLVQGDNFATGTVVEIGGRIVPAADVELVDVHHLLVRKTPVHQFLFLNIRGLLIGIGGFLIFFH